MFRPIRKILVVKLRTLGDVLTAFPLLRALKERFPQASLHMIADDVYADLFATHPRVDRFWAHPAKALRAGGSLREALYTGEFIGRLRRERYDLYVDLYGTLRTALWGAAAGIPRRLGFDLRGRRYFYTDRVRAACRYVVDLNLQFARLLGWEGHDRSLELFLTPEDEAAALAHLTGQGYDPERPLLAVSPSGGWPVKCWPAERFGQAARDLRDRTGAQVVLTGTPAEAPALEACGQALGRPYLTAVGLPLRQAAAVVRRARLFLGNDSGPKYFAEAFGVPTLICYGPTDHLNNNPDSPRHQIASTGAACRPCHSEICRAGRRSCLDDLSVETVAAAAREMWDQTAPGAGL